MFGVTIAPNNHFFPTRHTLNNTTTPNILRTRFQEEYASTKAYVDLLTKRMSVYGADINRVVADLVRLNLLAPNHQLPRSRWSQPYTASELNTINETLKSVRQNVEASFNEWRLDVEQMQADEAFASIPTRTYDRELVEFFVDRLKDDLDATDEQKEGWFAELRSQIIRNNEEYGDEAQFINADVEPMLTATFKYASYIHKSKTAYNLETALVTIDELEVISQSLQPGDMLNIYRQAFIVLLTAFDATIFDLMRVALRQDFFRLIGAIGKKETLSLRDLSNYQSFEQLRDSTIEEQLKTRYLKDILLLLDNQQVELVDASSDQKLWHLVELVLRRNLHMHNRGVVDRRYLETKDDGTPRFNVYGLSEGDTAEIDNTYWFGACKLCLDCVDRVALWAEGLNPPTMNQASPNTELL